jgi:signal peptidase I
MTNARLAQSLRHTVRVAMVLAVLAAVGSSRVDAGIKSQRQLTAILAQTPAAKLVAEGEQLKQAEKVAAQIKDATAFLGIGHSMEPLYAPNTAVVVAPINYDQIKKGMTVVYVKSNGRRVAHAVIGETRDGYLVQGLNNDEADTEVVNEQNLVGVIVQAYASADTTFRSEMTKKLAAQGLLPVAAGRRG